MVIKMSETKISETITENIFRSFYGATTFIEKTAIPLKYGFTSKQGTNYSGYPDFFMDAEDYCILVEAKAEKHSQAEIETKFYMIHNNINKDIIGIALSGQSNDAIRMSIFFRKARQIGIDKILQTNCLLSLDTIYKKYISVKSGTPITEETLTTILKELNKRFHENGRIRDTERSLFFSGLMIALKNKNFRSTYMNIQPPSNKTVMNEAHYMNLAILEAVNTELSGKINNLSKEYSWRDKFSFIKNIDYPLEEYKNII